MGREKGQFRTYVECCSSRERLGLLLRSTDMKQRDRSDSSSSSLEEGKTERPPSFSFPFLSISLLCLSPEKERSARERERERESTHTRPWCAASSTHRTNHFEKVVCFKVLDG